MKKTLILFVILISLSLSACGAQSVIPAFLPSEDSQQPQASPQATAQPSRTPTATVIPTVTVDWQSTAVSSQATADVALRLMVEVTAEQDRREFQKVEWTHEAGMFTQQAANATATAWQTAYPITQTAQYAGTVIALTKAEDQRNALAATLQAPTLIVAIADAQAQAKYAEKQQKAEVGIKISIGFFVLSLAVFLVITILRSPLPANKQEQVEINQLDPIPFARDKQSDGERFIRAEIQCANEQLLLLAEGIINEGKTLAFNMWEGTPVHKSLKYIREFFIENHFAKLIKGQGGAMDMAAEGEKFLRDCLDLGHPPAPYRCVVQND